MSKEVEEAIKNCNLLLAGDIMLHILDDDGGTAYSGVVNKLYNKDLETVLNYIKELERKIKIKDEYCELIYELGFDYDGLNTVESLKGLIDNLVDYAKKSIKNDDKSVVFEGVNDTKFNILREEITKSEE